MRGVSERNILDDFCIKFCSVVEKHCKYIVVSGFVAISSGRSRATEDIDMIIEKLDIDRFKKLHEDLTKEGVRVSLGRENACAICKLIPLILKKADIHDEVLANAVTGSRITVSEMCLDVTTGQADAAVVWRSSAYKYEKHGQAEIIEIAEKYNIIETIPIVI